MTETKETVSILKNEEAKNIVRCLIIVANLHIFSKAPRRRESTFMRKGW